MTNLAITMIEFLKAFPAVLGVIGTIVGGLAVYAVMHKIGPLREAALRELVATHQKTLDAHVQMQKVQSEQHLVQLNMQKDHWAEELRKMEASRDEYKTISHQVRNDLGGANTALQLKVQELELRPNVDIIAAEQKRFFQEMVVSMQQMNTGLVKLLDTLKVHDDSIEERTMEIIKPVRDMCEHVVFALNGHKLIVETSKVTTSKSTET